MSVPPDSFILDEMTLKSRGPYPFTMNPYMVYDPYINPF